MFDITFMDPVKASQTAAIFGTVYPIPYMDPKKATIVSFKEGVYKKKTPSSHIAYLLFVLPLSLVTRLQKSD